MQYVKFKNGITPMQKIPSPKKNRYIFIFFIFSFHHLFAQEPSTNDLKKLSIEELMGIEVTSVSKRPEKLSTAASAIQVITQEDIRQSGAISVPEALRLAPNLQVAQVNSSQWAISARGFNNVLANKLLVLIDGRTVYTPLYAGVYWDVQNLVLEDIERIEVISGPGGTLWGANAVNGVINIITKNAKNTNGFFAEGATGSKLRSMESLRYGGKIADNFHFRVYGTAFKRGSTTLQDSMTSAHDAWSILQGGMRLDWTPTIKDAVSLQLNDYSGHPDPDGGSPVIAKGKNVVGNWNHTISEKSDFQVKLFGSQTFRDFNNGFAEKLNTYDLEWQQRFHYRSRHEIIWGAGYRYLNHSVTNLELFGFSPATKQLNLFSGFIQDEISLLQNQIKLTIGSKVEHYTYTGYQYQPNARLTFIPNMHHTFWTAVSRAIKLPARIDEEFAISIAPGVPLIQGSTNMKAEKVIAYELGWRLQPHEKISLSLSSFYNVYDDIRSAEPGSNPGGIPITFGNGVKGKTYGAELAFLLPVTDYWKLRGGYTFLKKNLVVKNGSADLNQASAESNDPKHQFLLQSAMTLPGNFEFGVVARYVRQLPKPKVESYVGVDIRVSWKVVSAIELSLVAQNLGSGNHTEFNDSSHPPRLVEQSVYGKLIVRYDKLHNFSRK